MFQVKKCSKLKRQQMVLKKIRETPSDRALAKVHKYLRDNALNAVLFDKGFVLCYEKEHVPTKTGKITRLLAVQKT